VSGAHHLRRRHYPDELSAGSQRNSTHRTRIPADLQGVVNQRSRNSTSGNSGVIPTPGLSQYELPTAGARRAPSNSRHQPVVGRQPCSDRRERSYQRSAPPQGGTLIIGAPTLGLVSTNNQQSTIGASVVSQVAHDIVIADGSPFAGPGIAVPISFLTWTDSRIPRLQQHQHALPAVVPLQLNRVPCSRWWRAHRRGSSVQSRGTPCSRTCSPRRARHPLRTRRPGLLRPGIGTRDARPSM